MWRDGADSRYIGGTTAGVAELADAQDLGWVQTRPRDEQKALNFSSHRAFLLFSGIVWADRSNVSF
jgi:hypothetical protein